MAAGPRDRWPPSAPEGEVNLIVTPPLRPRSGQVRATSEWLLFHLARCFTFDRPDGELSSSNHDYVQDQQGMARPEQDAEKSYALSEDGMAYPAREELRVSRDSGKTSGGNEEAAAGLNRLVLGLQPCRKKRNALSFCLWPSARKGATVFSIPFRHPSTSLRAGS